MLFDGAYANLGEVTVFYGWLRTPSAKVIGIRLCREFMKDNGEVFSSAKALKYCQVAYVRALEIFFGNERKYQPELSGDQGFGHSSAWKATSKGNLACSIDTDWLKPGDLDHLNFVYRQ